MIFGLVKKGLIVGEEMNEDWNFLKAIPLKLLNIKYKIFANALQDLSSSGHKPLTLTVHRALGAK